MSPPPGSFSWLSFLLGFAIALWAALVLLFILPEDDSPAAACPSCCCQGPGWPGPTPIPDWPLTIPSGNEPYTCANNDNGGGVVKDNGGGVVKDNGGGVVKDGVPQIPAPTDDTLGDDRELDEFQCDLNDNGGGVVKDSGNDRHVVVPMKKDDDLYCANILGYASVLKKDGSDFILLSYDSNGDPIELGSPTDTANKVQFPPGETGDGWAFCSVTPNDTSDPEIVDDDNMCIAKPGGC
ncbi:MAG: hypothetical protein ACR2QZ_00160 [Woeseiaceae bacterium]